MVTSGFFESMDKDRVYNSDDFCNILDPIITYGVLEKFKDKFSVELPTTINDGLLQVVVKPGKAFYKNKFIDIDTDELVDIAESPAYNQRWDAIVLDFDLREEVREYSVKYVKGEALREDIDRSTGTTIYSMYLPDLIREENHMQYPLAYILIKKNITKLESKYIVNRVGKEQVNYIEYEMNGIIYRLKTKDKSGVIKEVYGCPFLSLKNHENIVYNSSGQSFKYLYFYDDQIKDRNDFRMLKLDTTNDQMILIDSDDPKYIDIHKETMFVLYEEVEE